MNDEFRLPHITGSTPQEQISQIIAYLRQTALLLQNLPVTPPAEEKKTLPAARSCRFPALQVDGGINGLYTRRVRVWGSTSFCIRSRFPDWNSTGGQRQSLLLTGSANGTPILGVIVVGSGGSCAWSGSEAVTLTAEEGGVIRVTFRMTCYDYFILQSPEAFTVL